jgi:hypothetical protein
MSYNWRFLITDKQGDGLIQSSIASSITNFTNEEDILRAVFALEIMTYPYSRPFLYGRICSPV